MIFVDSNIPMYLIGADHPHKHDAKRLLDRVISRGERLVTDAEALQEILHRYHAIGRPEAMQPAFDLVLALVDEVIPIDRPVASKAKDILLGALGLSARDAVHLASMQSVEAHRIMSFDADYDLYPGIERLS
jgi:predicted nucleic acid-binding protein